MTRADFIDRFVEEVASVIDSSDITLAQLAKELNVSVKTIQKWKDDGTTFPSFTNTFALYDACAVNPEYSIHKIIRPEIINFDYNTISIDKLREFCIRLTKIQDDRCLAILYYIFFGNHGSDPKAYMQMGLANARSTVGYRHLIATVTYHNYEVAKQMDRLTDPNAVQPDLESAKSAINKGQEAYFENKRGYVKFIKESRHTYKHRLASEMKFARERLGVDTKTLSKNLGVSENTILKYEYGESEPNIIRFFDWGNALKVHPEAVARAVMHPAINEYRLDINTRNSMIKELEYYFNHIAERCTLNAVHYILSGSNKSSVYDYLQLALANLQTPIGNRQIVATLIDINYVNVERTGVILPGPEPDMDTFREALKAGTEAYIKGEKGYS